MKDVSCNICGEPSMSEHAQDIIVIHEKKNFPRKFKIIHESRNGSKNLGVFLFIALLYQRPIAKCSVDEYNMLEVLLLGKFEPDWNFHLFTYVSTLAQCVDEASVLLIVKNCE